MKKEKKNSKKLFLLKETIVKLDHYRLSKLYGGAGTKILTQTGLTGVVGPDTLYDPEQNGPLTK